MNHDQDIILEIHNWPLPGDHRRHRIDPRIFRDADALREHCRVRYGNGTLRQVGPRTYRFVRRVSAGWLTLLRNLLNKSYS